MSLLNSGDKIYYNLKFANIYNNIQKIKNFDVKNESSIILEKQSNYRLAIHSFRLDMIIPLFLMPIKEGFVFNSNITNISKSFPCVITTSINHNLIENEYINIINVLGMTQINGEYLVREILSPTSFSINTLFSKPVSSENYDSYTSGGQVDNVNGNINLTDLGLCLSVGGNDYFSSILYIPDKNLTEIPEYLPLSPRQNNGVQDNKTRYYYTYSFNTFVKMINTAFINATSSLNIGESSTYEPPFIEYDSLSGLFSVIVPYSYVSNNIDVFMNVKLTSYLGGIRYEFQGLNKVNFKDNKLILENNNYTNSYAKKGDVLPVPPANPKYLKFIQEYDTRYKFDEIVSLIITSNYIKCRSEYYPQIANPNSSQIVLRQNNSFNTSTQSIISVFDLIDGEGLISWREVQYYQPKIYKWIDLISDDALNKVDVQIYYETKKGEFLLATIDTGSQSNIRFVFEKK
jgi:hypothetical protein